MTICHARDEKTRKRGQGGGFDTTTTLYNIVRWWYTASPVLKLFRFTKPLMFGFHTLSNRLALISVRGTYLFTV